MRIAMVEALEMGWRLYVHRVTDMVVEGRSEDFEEGGRRWEEGA